MRLVGSGSQQPAEGGRWGTVLAVQRERLVSPDLYLLPRETFDHTDDGVNEGWVGVGGGLGANGRF